MFARLAFFSQRSFSLKLLKKFQTPSLLFEDNLETLNPVQKKLQSEAADFALNNIKPYNLEWDRTETFPKDLMRLAGKLGYGGVCGSIKYGGRVSGKIGASLIFEAMAEWDACISAYISIHNMLGLIIETHGTEEQKNTYLSKLFSLEFIGSYCLTEPHSGSDAIAMKTTAVLNQDDYVINGNKSLVVGAGENQVFLIFCLTAEKEVSAFIIDSNTKGIALSRNQPKLGFNPFPVRDVNFSDCRVPKRNLVGRKGDGFRIAMKTLEAERLNISSCALGGASSCLKQTIDYLKNKMKAGTMNNDSQLKIAEIASKLMACKLILRQAARSMDNKEKKSFMYSARTKWFVPSQAFEIIGECLQITQEDGLTSSVMTKNFRDVRAFQFAGGTVEIMKHALQRELFN